MPGTDIALNSTFYDSFCAFRVDTGAPADVASIVVSAYPDNSATQITAGITLTQPDSITGRYCIAVAATVANGYAAGVQYSLTITTGTVNSVSVVGSVVSKFQIRVGVPGLIATGVAQASAAGTLVLAAATSYADDLINGSTAVIVAGTGVGQTRQIYDFVGSTDTCSVSPNWVTTPDTTSVYEIYATPPSGTAAGSLPSVSVGALLDDATAAQNLQDDYDGTGYAGGTINKKANAVQIGSQTASASGTITFPNATLASTTGAVGSVTGAVGSVTGAVGSIGTGGIVAATFAAGAIDAAAIAADAIGSSEFSNAAAAKVFTQAMTEAYAADGAAATPAQLLYLLLAALTEFSVSGTTVTLKKLDGSTTAATLTVDSATAPTSVTRAT